MRALLSVSRFGFVLSASFLASCSGGGGNPRAGGTGGGIQTAPNVVYTIPGPYSQAYTPAGGTPFTATQVTLTYIGFPGMPSGQSYESLRVDITFSQDISTALPAPGTMLSTATQLGVYVGLDVDDNETTGLKGIGCQGFPGQTSGGDEFFVDAGTYYGRLSDGNYTLVKRTQSSGNGGFGEAVTSVNGNMLTEIIDLGTLGSYGSSIPRIGVFVNALNGTVLEFDGTGPIGQCSPAQNEFVTG